MVRETEKWGRSSSLPTVWPCSLSTGPQGRFGERLGALVEPLYFNFLTASTVWLQAPGTRRWPVSPRRHEAPRSTHPSGEHRALSRGQGVRSKCQTAPFLSAFWKPTAMSRHGDRGPEHLSVQTQTPGRRGGGRGVGDRKDGDSQAPLPTPSSAYPPEVKSPVARGGGAHSEAWQQLGFGFLTSFCCKESQ